MEFLIVSPTRSVSQNNTDSRAKNESFQLTYVMTLSSVQSSQNIDFSRLMFFELDLCGSESVNRVSDSLCIVPTHAPEVRGGDSWTGSLVKTNGSGH